MRTVPATPRLSPSMPFLLGHRARRRGPGHPQFLCYQRRCRFLVVRVTGHRSGRRTTPAVISLCSGTALTRLISRSTPYLTFLQHQQLLSVSIRVRSRLHALPGPQRSSSSEAPSAAPRVPSHPPRGSSSAPSPAGPKHPGTQGIRFPSYRTTRIATFSSQPCAISWERVEGVSRSLPFSDLLALTSCHMFVSVMI